MKYRSVLFCLLAAYPMIVAGEPQDHVLVISIDGFRPGIYLEPEKTGVAMPNLTALARRGVSADRVISVFPAMTFPAHTTIVTGVEPGRHGITSNTRFGSTEWISDAAEIRAPTLWQAARAASITTATIEWPMTYGADIDWLLTLNWSVAGADASHDRSLLTTLKRGSTKGLLEHLEGEAQTRLDRVHLKDSGVLEHLDRANAAYATQILKEHRPGLMLIHFGEADHMQHRFGPDSDQARRAFERIDGLVGGLLDAVSAAGISGNTDVIVIGDHGFAPADTVIDVGRMLLDTGYATRKDGVITSDLVDFESYAGSGTFHARPGVDPERLAAFYESLKHQVERHYRGVLDWLAPADVIRLGGRQDAVAGLTVTPGYSLGRLGDTPGTARFLPSTRYRGVHGHTPELPAMATGLIAAGPSFRSGERLEVARLLDVAPTIAWILQLDLKDADGDVMAGALRNPAE